MANKKKKPEISKFQRSFDKLQNAQNNQLQLSSLYLAKVMTITDFFQEFLRSFIQEKS
jgi:hypothetical protein